MFFYGILFMVSSMKEFVRVNVKDYVTLGIENGDLIPFWAIKYGRVRARRGNLGELVNTNRILIEILKELKEKDNGGNAGV